MQHPPFGVVHVPLMDVSEIPKSRYQEIYDLIVEKIKSFIKNALHSFAVFHAFIEGLRPAQVFAWVRPQAKRLLLCATNKAKLPEIRAPPRRQTL